MHTRTYTRFRSATDLDPVLRGLLRCVCAKRGGFAGRKDAGTDNLHC